MKWGILGQGVIACQMAEALIREQGSIYAVAGRHMEKVEAFAKTYKIEKAYTIMELLTDKDVDIVYIATPHSNHYEYIMQALHEGKHVLCEKAITVNKAQLMDAVQLAQEKNLILMEAMTIFHMPIMKKVKTLIEEGVIGKVKMIQVNFGSCKEYDVTNRFFSPALAGGALLDIGTYAISFARYFLSQQPDTILTTMLPFETGVDEMSGILLKNKKEEMATITLTMRAKLPKKGIIAGDKGYIEINDYPRAKQAMLKLTQNGEETILKADEDVDALRYEIQDMEKAIQEQNNPTLQLTSDVTCILTEVRNQWGMKYPFE